MAILDLPGTTAIRIGHRGPVLVCCFLGWPSGAPLRAMADAQLALARQYGRVTILAIIPVMDPALLKQQGDLAQMNLPDAERSASLKESAATGKTLESSTLASALVILPRGLLAVMIRSFVGAMSLVSTSQAPLQTFKELVPAIAWLEGQPQAGVTPGLQRDVEEWLQK